MSRSALRLRVPSCLRPTIARCGCRSLCSSTQGCALANRVMSSIDRRLSASNSLPSLPSGAEVAGAVNEVVRRRNGHTAWRLYSLLREGDVHLSPEQMAVLAGTMLDVNQEDDGALGVQRTLTVIRLVMGCGKQESL